MFSTITNSISSFFQPYKKLFNALFSKSIIDEQSFKELERILIAADTGRSTTHTILAAVKQYYKAQSMSGSQLKDALQHHLISTLKKASYVSQAEIYFIIGVNGSGKTTAAAKIAHHVARLNKKVLLVAADTFRAAAAEQLSTWAHNYQIPIITGTQGQDPSAVLFNAIQHYKANAYDILIIDTAGRLHTNHNLMAELAKMHRVLHRHLSDKKSTTLLTIDGLLGQSSLEQVRLFKESIPTNGIILTKLDSSSKGGIIFSIINEFEIPVAYVSFGEKIEDIAPLDPDAFVKNMLNE